MVINYLLNGMILQVRQGLYMVPRTQMGPLVFGWSLGLVWVMVDRLKNRGNSLGLPVYILVGG